MHAGPGQHPGGRRAVLPGVEVAGAGDPGGGRGRVGVVEDDDRRLASELQVDPLERGRRRGGHLHAGAHDPVTDTMAGIGWPTRARPVSRSPQTTLKTPGGRYSAMISAISSVETGVVSEGFSTMVFPAAKAGANFHTAIIMG